MKIILTVDPEIPVPPKHYGGIERIIDMIIPRYQGKGHEVTLFSHPESTVSCERIAWKGRNSGSKSDTLRNMLQLRGFVDKVDSSSLVIHSFARLVYLLPLFRKSIPLIQSYQRAITGRSVRFGRKFAGTNLTFTACSSSCAQSAGEGSGIKVVYNGVPVDRYPAATEVSPDAPLVFLGRMEKIKGPHVAVEVAKRTKRKLILAGNLSPSPVDRDFVERNVLSQCDGKQITYVGPVDDRQKGELLSRAACLLFPIEWEEPFGIVMVEAMACGAPVLAFPRGAAPEVVKNAVNGFLCKNVDEMCLAVDRLDEIERSSVRESVEKHYSDAVIAREYLSLYESLLADARLR